MFFVYFFIKINQLKRSVKTFVTQYYVIIIIVFKFDFMDEKQIISKLKKLSKPYAGIMNQSTFSSTIIRYEAGLLKPNTLKGFLEKMKPVIKTLKAA